jgi:hypothetical protein
MPERPNSEMTPELDWKTDEAYDLMSRFLSAVLLGTLALTLVACSGGAPTASLPEQKAAATDTPPPARPKQPCAIKLTNSRMVHNLEMDVSTTVTNISADITAIALVPPVPINSARHERRTGPTYPPKIRLSGAAFNQ